MTRAQDFIFRYLSLIIFTVFLLLWEILARTNIISPMFFPQPSRIFTALISAIGSGEIFNHTICSLYRLLVGFIIGGSCGLIIGIMMGWSKRIRHFMNPFVSAIHPIPKIAILPLVMVIFGIGEVSKLALIALTALFPMLINAYDGVRQIQPVYLDVANNLKCSRWLVFKELVLPGSLPFVMSGVRLSINTAFLLTVAIELVSAERGLGAYIWMAWQTLRVEKIYAALVIISILGITINLIHSQATSWLVPWQSQKQIKNKKP